MKPIDLITFRKRYKWTQSELAKKLGCSTRSVSNWEKGVNPVPKNIALACSAVAMNLPPYECS